MNVTLFNMRGYERDLFERLKTPELNLKYVTERLTLDTADAARGSAAVCCFANDQLQAPVLQRFGELGVKLIALRSAGYNHVDLEAAKRAGLPVVRVPEYSPYAVAEHAVALLQTLNRKIHRAYNRVRELNFSLEGLVGFDLHGKTVGVIGAGRIGRAFARIMHGYGCRVLVYDQARDAELEKIATYSDLPELLLTSDIVSLHIPLSKETYHLLNAERLQWMKAGAFVINTGRGALIDTPALIAALKHKRLGGACLDVYEEEENVFFQDLSSRGLDDDCLARLLTFPNVLVTSHQAFLTTEALTAIVTTTLANLQAFASGGELQHRVV